MRARGIGRAAALMAALLPGGVAAAEPAPPPEVRLHLEPSEATVGDPVTVTLEVEAPAGVAVAFPDRLPRWGKAAVLETQSPPPEPAGPGGRVRHRRLLRLAAFEPGTIELPPLEVRVGEGSGAVVVATPPAAIQVRSVLPEGEAELADLRGPWDLPEGLRWIPWAIAAAALAAAAIGYGLWRRRRRTGAVPAPAPAPPLSADEEALAALAALLGGPLLPRGRIKEFHVALADIVKRYLGRRYGVPTLERTSAEVLEDAAAAGLEEPASALLAALLGGCDAVKFARHRPEIAACRELAGQARELVACTRRVPAPAVGAVPMAAEA